jgi:hypothetical protein
MRGCLSSLKQAKIEEGQQPTQNSNPGWMYVKEGKCSRLSLIVLLMIFNFVCLNDVSLETVEIDLPEMEPVELQPFAVIDFPAVNEASGLVKSRLWKDVFWTHNDSGDEPRIFPVREDGRIIKPLWMREYGGIRIPDSVNVDWESITTDDKGNLYIGDIGNNSNTRRDLCFYIVEEPYPSETVVTRVSKRISFYYSDQKSIPPKRRNYDAEAMFWKRGKIYILTKHRSDTYTKLYRLDSMNPFKENPAVPIGRFNCRGQVSGADISPDGLKLALLTYNSVWLFEVSNNKTDDYFNGKVFWLPIKAVHAEAICLDGNRIIMANEEGELFRLNKNDLLMMRE